MIRKLILILALLTSFPLCADDAAPRLFIERIEVRNTKRVSPDVVVSETRLRAGRDYTEADLRDAATRLTRLPFLLSVDFALEKGSERGKHILVLTVHETKPFFFLVDAVPYFDDTAGLDLDTEDRQGPGETLALGYRWFVGRRGAFHVGLSAADTDRPFTSEYASLVAGYTRYDLFGTRAFATLNLKRPLEGYGEGQIAPQVVIGVPLSVNQTLTLEYDDTQFTGDTFQFEGEERSHGYGQRLLSARWSYNTTNDPFFPTSGTLLSVRPEYAWIDRTGAYSISYPKPITSWVFHSTVMGAEAGATRYHELSERNSAWGELRGKWGRVDERSRDFPDGVTRDASSVSVAAAFAHSLWSPEERASGDSRLELTARYTNHLQSEYGKNTQFQPDVFQLAGSWIRRSSWGTLRIGVGYAW